MAQITCGFCETSYEDSLKRCPQCRTKTPQKTDVGVNSAIEYLPLCIAQGVPERDILLSILKDEGIAAYSEVADDTTPDAIFGDSGFGAAMQIFVDATLHEQAAALYKEYESTPMELDEDTEYWKIPGQDDKQE